MKKVLVLAFALFLNMGLCFAEPCAGENKHCSEYYPGTKSIKAKYKLKDGKKEGKYREYFPNKKLKVLANYEAGLLEGEHLTYYDNAQIMQKDYYKNNQKHGVSYLYNLEGKLLNSTTYYYGKKQGYSYDYLTETKIEKYYDNDELAVQKEYTYDDVLLEEKKYYKSGDKKTTKYYYTDISDHVNKITQSKHEREKLVDIFKKTKYTTFETLTLIKEGKTIETTRFYNDNNIAFYTYKFEIVNNKIIAGDECEYDENGHMQIERKFSNSYKNMSFITFYPNGNIESKGQFRENPTTKTLDFKEGDFYNYNTQGRMIGKTIYKNNKEIDAFIWNYHPNGEYSLAGRIKNGKPNGIQTLYYDNGKPEMKSNFLNGKLHGKSTSYSYTGKVKVIENYTNGVLNGKKTTFYQNGNVKAEAIFKNGKLEGPFISYHENGAISAKGSYLNDKGNGNWVKYYKSGNPEADCNYKNGKKHGTCKKYWENGNYAYIDFFENNTLKNRRAFNAYGKELWSQKY